MANVPTIEILAILILQCVPPLVIFWIIWTRFRRQAVEALPFLSTLPFLMVNLFLVVFLLWLLVFYGFVFRWALRAFVRPG